MKKLAIIGGSICFIGVIIFISALGAVGWNIGNISTHSTYEEKQFTTQNNNQPITIHDYNISVTVGKSNDDQIHFIYYENDKETYKIEDSATLTAERKNDYKWYDYIFNINFQFPSFTILLPENYSGNLDIQTSNGSIIIDHKALQQLSAKTSNAYIGVKNLTVAENMTLITSNNKIEVNDTTIGGQLSNKSSNGSIYLTNITAKAMDATTSNGEIKAINTQTSQNTMLKSSNGRIHVEDLKAETEIYLKTSNNQIDGTIIGKDSDFTITSHTSNASNNLPETFGSGEKQLIANTSNGRIFLEFTR